MTFHDARTHRARKQHKCGECFRVIEPGELYARHAGVWEGDFWTMKSCPQCDTLRDVLLYVDSDFWEGCYGGICEWLHEMVPYEIDSSFSWLFRLKLLRVERLFRRKWAGQSHELEDLLVEKIIEKRRRMGLQRERVAG
ncbi:hypothetical protein SEA_SICARIUS2_50 [Arthrobacter phage Sicarius2]|uniref:Uncharacterized protein n=1 Tax=Arthrobacter phage Sicarius2 TaxID=2836090 RepID=A0A8F3E5R1_9CAUD|nr:hypothetical protein SEA_SICARIUS2_50 [Arthrobacter phage Sicarius2]